MLYFLQTTPRACSTFSPPGHAPVNAKKAGHPDGARLDFLDCFPKRKPYLYTLV